MCRFLLLAGIAALNLIGGGCSDAPSPRFHSIDITGGNYATDFRLTDHDRRTRTLADYRGKVVTLFFGYLHCPDFCPTHLARQREVMRLLGADADRVQTLFMTVDPERDDTVTLKAFVTAFDPRFVGLRASLSETVATAQGFHAFYQKVPLPDSALGYSMDHSTTMVVFDRRGRPRLVIKHEQSATEVAADLRVLLAE